MGAWGQVLDGVEALLLRVGALEEVVQEHVSWAGSGEQDSLAERAGPLALKVVPLLAVCHSRLAAACAVMADASPTAAPFTVLDIGRL
ncbi:hypothetical protein HaLaN_24536 [Haematococcus lacustris]|uniref:Uncharacterized protein n=1 Tax=Haematococcus lacustris TaxID=44745 RepID=A0A6A0A4U4_HAELA|nr:hypothetical protein HaLaN_24536 [Haematococcus lacustris]